ncbi:GNAT family N-acetyltransferase [Sagittula stellata]|uniref:Acetyltransferase, GNAT family protein n=1 Tax=Sagittula stellata (strain ATCC 700073 / DSM 11524 / E-37) TaxID=388399 RepID=A3KAZ6_SAGS3|nr:GNAT family N-acetyltransferase [Sagittula stellata]EBA05665.1 acetyltransferase, GNAT family protein [Sagittula stellata E-37]
MLKTRPITADDALACMEILNFTIAQGGTTAYEEPFTQRAFIEELIDRPAIGIVVETLDRIVGFQSAFDIGDGLYSIGSFTDRQAPVKGAGRALFNATLAACRARGGVAILARITSDNASGLGYYSHMGFADDHVIPGDVTRKDGTVVDRVVKRYPL